MYICVDTVKPTMYGSPIPVKFKISNSTPKVPYIIGIIGIIGDNETRVTLISLLFIINLDKI